MALNMDDLIGSMQHGFHAGDRGNDLNEIRESLKVSLGPQHPSNANPPIAGPSNSQFAVRRNPFQQPPGASSLDADVAMLSSSQQYQPQQGYEQSFFGGSSGGPGSWGSQSSSSSGNAGGGWRFAPAPANTPQQTPVETSALARQLQAELERQQQAASVSPPHQQYTASNGVYSSPPHTQPGRPDAGTAEQDAPRSFVNGFSPARDESATPRGSLSPRLRGAATPR